ncbi:MAG: class I SAM-dependent methyltransferase [Verrucomicrobiota bacterium JB025]|nr:class I SAM-dependent methyltransferase [Verrucomicrobiota bacterium JB025]
MFPPRPTELVHTLLRPHLHPGDTAVDATAGNGHDTLFLAKAVGNTGRVLAFDVQPQAIDATRRALHHADVKTRVDLFLESHTGIAAHLPANSAAAVIFNLGYLPGQDHDLTTEPGETLHALTAAATVLKPRGILSVVCYPGHQTGAAEARAVETHLTALASQRWRIAKYAMLGTLKPAPFLLLATKNPA